MSVVLSFLAGDMPTGFSLEGAIYLGIAFVFLAVAWIMED